MDLGRFLRAEWDRLAGYGFLLAGAVALVFGFAGVRTSADVIDEISYLVTGGIGAVFLLGVGATLLLSADLHDDFRKLHRVEEKLDAIHRALLETRPDLVVDVRPPVSNDGADSNGADAVAHSGAAPAVTPAGTAALAAAGTAAPVAAGTAAPVAAGTAAPGAPPASSASVAPGLLAVRRFRRLAVPVGAVGAGLFVTGAVVTAHQASTDHMAGGVGLALSGSLLVAVLAGAVVGQLKGRLEQRTLAALGPWLGRDDDGTGPRPAAPAAEVWVVDGLSLYHRAGCRALDGRTAGRHDPAALAAGLQPCGLCEPGPRR